jgi:hypothetical protein
MLNINVNRSADGVERYFDRELAVSDYLMKEPGVWGGTRSGTVRTPRPCGTGTVCSTFAKPESGDR